MNLVSGRAWTAHAGVHVRVGASWLAFVAVMILAPGGGSFAAEHDHEAGGEPPEAAHLSAEMAPVAKRAWKDLVCLCGRCARLTLAACRCPDAAAERQKVIELLKPRALSSQAATDAAYRAVMDSYVARFGGPHVLASENARRGGDGGFIALGVLLLTSGGAVVFMEVRRRRGGPRARKARSLGRRRGA